MLERFTSHYRVADSGCWEWTGAITPGGYGLFWLDKKTQYSHRVSYMLYNGAIPIGLEIDHLCRNRKCCNPKHLEAVTRSENARRGINGERLAAVNHAKTHCPKGHVYSGENLYTRNDKPSRDCNTCRREASRRYRLKLKEAL